MPRDGFGRARRVVRDEGDPLPEGAQPRDGLGRSRDRFRTPVQHSVQVEQDRVVAVDDHRPAQAAAESRASVRS